MKICEILRVKNFLQNQLLRSDETVSYRLYRAGILQVIDASILLKYCMGLFKTIFGAAIIQFTCGGLLTNV